MNTIDRIEGRAGPTAPRARRSAPGFGISLAGTDAAPASVAAGFLAGMDAVFALQERDEDVAADRRARRHGTDLLAALSRLQAALLHPDGIASVDLARLAALGKDTPFAADMGLRELLGAIGLRARIELARRGGTR